MAMPPHPSADPGPPLPGRLALRLVTLAETPETAPQIDAQLVEIARLAADLVAPVSYASVTARREGAYTTVAASSEVALAVDEAQYADRSGPCLDAIDGGAPVAVPDVEATMAWPGFRDAAFGLGLRASLSIPLFAGSGAAIAALNLYGRDPATMTPLTVRVLAVYDPDRSAGDNGDRPALDRGSDELLSGLGRAFAVRARIQQAIGVIMSGGQVTAEDAYLVLRLRAAQAGASLTDAATAVIRDAGAAPT